MSPYPLIFGLRDIVQGNGFLATVAVQGRALLHDEGSEGVWVEGVNPGGFVATGSSVAEALEDYRRSYRAIVFDIAEDAASFEAFEREVKAFVGAGAEAIERDWQQAVEDLRAGRLSADWLRRRSADLPPGIKVDRVDEPSAENNQVEEGAALAA